MDKDRFISTRGDPETLDAPTATRLVLYGDWLIALGLGMLLFHPCATDICFLVGSASGILAIFLGFLATRGCSWSLRVAGPSVGVMTFIFAGWAGWSWWAVWQEPSQQWAARAILSSLMLAASIPMLARLRHQHPARRPEGAATVPP